ncbi:MAG: carbohydrate-binding family 9-like protein [Armatimonadota bacterium]|nr:carbohydrate-binding family 9-like protein [Armatimonadota bacterium]
MKTTFPIVALVLILIGGVAAGQERVREITVPSASTAPLIDGTMSESVWNKAARIQLGRCAGVNAPVVPTFSTMVLLLWDAQYLYVGFKCNDKDIWSTYDKRDMPLWEEEVVEVYLDPLGKGEHYKEFEVNPLGALMDLDIPRAVDGNPGDWKPSARWNSRGIRWKTRVLGTLNKRDDRDTGWVVEMAIPLRECAPTGAGVRVGDIWRAQFFRIDRKTLGDANAEFLTWSPTDVFHRPERFGIIRFGAGVGKWR